MLIQEQVHKNLYRSYFRGYVDGYDKKKAIEAEIFKGMDKYINSDGTVKTANALFE